MADLGGFDARSVEPASAFEPLPAGRYRVVVTDSEEKPTKSGDASYMQFTFEVIEGPHAGRKLWARLNLNNPSAQAVQIARAELSALCRAVGVLTPQDTSELHDIPLDVKVSLRIRHDTGEHTNEIKGYFAPEQPQAKPQPARPAAPTPHRQPAAAPTWRRQPAAAPTSAAAPPLDPNAPNAPY